MPPNPNRSIKQSGRRIHACLPGRGDGLITKVGRGGRGERVQSGWETVEGHFMRWRGVGPRRAILHEELHGGDHGVAEGGVGAGERAIVLENAPGTARRAMFGDNPPALWRVGVKPA